MPTVEWMKIQREMLMAGVMPTERYVSFIFYHLVYFQHRVNMKLMV